ncbi:MAG: glycosyltransferase [Turicibacter sp.]|nr:glycosyltransferase [Turicibacter sp.]
MVMGGVSRVLNNLLSELVKQTEYDIDLLVLHKHGEMLKDVPTGVNIIEGSPFFSVIDLPVNQLIKQKNILLVMKKLYLLLLMKTGWIGRKIKSERKKMNLPTYDVEIAFKEGFCTIFVANGESQKKVNWVHLDYKKQNFSSNHMPLMKKTLHQIDMNVAVSKVAAQSYQEVFDLKDGVKVIHNIIQAEAIKEKANQCVKSEDLNLFNNKELTFISVGRLVEQKGYDRLIGIHQRLIQEGLKHNIMIIGNGEDDDRLKEEIQKNHCQETLKLIGYRENPFSYFKLARCFLLPSRYEGLPTVVFESLICQTPVIATKVAGIDEQLKGEKYGIVVENNDIDFYEALKYVIKHPEVLKKMEDNLKDYHYHNDVIINQFKRIVEGEAC